jgi:hypothetical protein
MESLKRSRGRILSSVGLTLGLVLFVGAATASADTLWAVVRYDGSVAAGKNVEFVARNGAGSYQVQFNKRDLAECAFVATSAGAHRLTSPPGQVSVSPSQPQRRVGADQKQRRSYFSDRGFHSRSSAESGQHALPLTV